MAKTALFRIDERLLHGQIARSWMNEVSADVIVVVNDEASKDKQRQKLMDLVTPMGSKTYFLPLEKATEKISGLREYKALVLVENPEDALELVKEGIAIDSINVGNIHQVSGKKQVNDNVYLGKDDIKALKQIKDAGKKLDFRTLFSDQPTSVDII